MSDRLNATAAAGIFQQFVAAINGPNVRALTALTTSDHAFVDPAGNVTRTATSMEVGWCGYFAVFPDNWIQPDHVLAEQGEV